MNLHNPATDLPAANALPVPSSGELVGTPAQQAFRAAVVQVEGLRQRLRELQEDQKEARRRYWLQVGPAARTVVEARQALFAPLEEALLLRYFSRLEEQQITALLIGNAQALQNRFGEDAADILRKYAPRRAVDADDDQQPEATAEAASEPADAHLPPHEQAAAQARNRRRSKAEKAQETVEKEARQAQQELLSNTKTLYRQLARTHHPDLQRDPTVQQLKTALMQRITEAYETNDLYTLLQLLSEATPTDSTDSTDDTLLVRYTQALHQQQLELKQQLNELKFGDNGFMGSTGKKREQEIRQLKRQLRAETDYLHHIGQLIREPESLREVLRELAAAGHDTV